MSALKGELKCAVELANQPFDWRELDNCTAYKTRMQSGIKRRNLSDDRIFDSSKDPGHQSTLIPPKSDMVMDGRIWKCYEKSVISSGVCFRSLSKRYSNNMAALPCMHIFMMLQFFVGFSTSVRPSPCLFWAVLGGSESVLVSQGKERVRFGLGVERSFIIIVVGKTMLNLCSGAADLRLFGALLSSHNPRFGSVGDRVNRVSTAIERPCQVG